MKVNLKKTRNKIMARWRKIFLTISALLKFNRKSFWFLLSIWFIPRENFADTKSNFSEEKSISQLLYGKVFLPKKGKKSLNFLENWFEKLSRLFNLLEAFGGFYCKIFFLENLFYQEDKFITKSSTSLKDVWV